MCIAEIAGVVSLISAPSTRQRIRYDEGNITTVKIKRQQNDQRYDMSVGEEELRKIAATLRSRAKICYKKGDKSEGHTKKQQQKHYIYLHRYVVVQW